MKPHFEELPIDQIRIDHRYQRDLDEGRVARMVKTYDPRQVGALIINHRGGGDYVCFDGQHRLAMLRFVGEGMVPCMVHEGLSEYEESELFDLCQKNRKSLSSLEIWRSELFRGVEPATTINAIVEEEGYTISNSTMDNAIAAVEAIRRIYRRGGEWGLRDVLRLARPWEGMHQGRAGHLLEGLGFFLVTVGKNLDLVRLANVLKATDPASLTARAAARQRTVGGGNRYVFYRDEILATYNRRLKSNRVRLVQYDEDEEGEEDSVEAA
jgi:hypothetical protein